MFKRTLLPILQKRLENESAAAVLLGPRQVGKTTLARSLANAWKSGAVYLDMERPADRARLDDPDGYLRAQRGKLVVLDEIHRLPQVFEVLRGIIDDHRAEGLRYGHFLLLGSASLDLMQQTSESLAGRVAHFELGGIAPDEALEAGTGLETLWTRGGFPESILAAGDLASLTWRQDFIRTYLERDVAQFAPRVPAQMLGRLWTMLAHNQGGLLNAAKLAAALGTAANTVTRYVDLLCDLQLVRRLSPWSANVGKRVTKTPKVYVRDSGIVHALLGLSDWDAVLGHPVAGMSYEGFVVEALIAAAGAQRVPYFYRTHDGAEIDLLFVRGGEIEMAIEVKRSSAPKVERGFTTAVQELAIAKKYVVYPGSARFGLRNGVEALGVTEMMAQLRIT
jgi:uncharacterized protein